MDYFKFRHLKVTALLLAMISMTACSSSQVDEPTGDTPRLRQSVKRIPLYRPMPFPRLQMFPLLQTEK